MVREELEVVVVSRRGKAARRAARKQRSAERGAVGQEGLVVSGWCGYCGEESDELRMFGPVEFGGPWVEPLDGGEPDEAGR